MFFHSTVQAPPRRIAVLHVESQVFIETLKGKNNRPRESVAWTGMPDDAQVVGIGLDGFNAVIFFIESDTFKEVLSGGPFPTLSVSETRYYSREAVE